MESPRDVAVFAGGCFWCTEAVFKMLKGVTSVVPGYAGGKDGAPTYESVSSGSTGHAEAVRIEFDPREISFDDLLTVFFATHDPTTLNRQGGDVGTQYRSAIYYSTPAQREAAERCVRDINASNEAGAPIVTEISPLSAFYPAEEYHRDYYARNRGAPYCALVIHPKLDAVQKRFAALLAKRV